MELFERIDLIVNKKYGGSRAKLAQALGEKQPTFNGYFNAKRQNKFKAIHLEKIIDLHPELNPLWLLTGKGRMETEGYTHDDGMLVGEAVKTPHNLGPVAERVDGIERAAPGTPLVDMLPFVIKNLRAWNQTVAAADSDHHGLEPDNARYAQEDPELKRPPGRQEDNHTKG